MLRVVLGDQLSASLSALDGLDPRRDLVLLAEVRAECTYVRHHKKKIVLVLSAMRHFAERLRHRGIPVSHVRLDDPDNTHSLRGEMLRAVAAHRPSRVLATHPGEWRLLDDMAGWADAAGVPVEILDDTRFLCGTRQFRSWASRRSGGADARRMEYFYRDMRRRHRVLMNGTAPAGERWNFDRDNRKRMPSTLSPPAVPMFPPDAITHEVIGLVAQAFGGHFGDLDGFNFPVTAEEAMLALDHFLVERLPGFGDWQDFMREGDPVLFHALISASLNLGLLDPLVICREAEAAWRAGLAPLNAVEGFVRQVLGWREFVRGVYWLHMPDYGRRNALGAVRPLPWFFWSGETRMRCVSQVVAETRRNAYAHHIQRLMVIGNFALLAGLDPDAVDEWFLVVYADAYQWVEMPNVRGMALFADDGVMGSKPYAASGAYIDRMSDYCRGCAYTPKQAVGPTACPFNSLYWDFLARHADRFAGNGRLLMPLRNLERMEPAKRAALRRRAGAFLDAMDRGEPV